jgi:hypothetical protein
MVIMAAPDPHKTRLITPLFKLGQIVSTPGAIEALSQPGTDWMALLMRHSTGDWGDLDAKDKRANDDAVMNGGRILSTYNLSTDARIWSSPKRIDPRRSSYSRKHVVRRDDRLSHLELTREQGLALELPE